jgi:hypothetical protein
MSPGRTQPITIPAASATPVREGALTERIGRLDRMPGATTEPPPMAPVVSPGLTTSTTTPMTAPSRGRRTTRETMPLYPQPIDAFDE